MSATHTPGRLKVQHPHAGERGWELALEPGLEQVCQDITAENARRLAACWNACEGIETYALELMTGDLSICHQIAHIVKARNKPTGKAVEYRRQRDELLDALTQAEAMINRSVSGLQKYDVPDWSKLLGTMQTAITKATGSAT